MLLFPGPPPVSQTLPNCATAFLYQLGQLYYYATVDCSTGATGYGTLGAAITPEGCDSSTEECAEGSTVTPTMIFDLLTHGLTGVSRRLLSTLAARQQPRKDPFGRSNSFQRALAAHFENFKKRKANQNDVDSRRIAVADYMLDDPGALGQTNLNRIFSQRKHIRDLLLDLIAKELNSVRIGAQDAISGVFLAKDEDLDKDTIAGEATTIATLFKPGEHENKTPKASAVGVQFTQGGTVSEFVRITTLGNPHTTQKDIFFRLQRVTLLDKTGAPTNETHYVGQQIFSDDVGHPSNRIATATFLDRHSHFHVIEAIDKDGKKNEYFVYSAEDISTREYLV